MAMTTMDGNATTAVMTPAMQIKVLGPPETQVDKDSGTAYDVPRVQTIEALEVGYLRQTSADASTFLPVQSDCHPEELLRDQTQTPEVSSSVSTWASAAGARRKQEEEVASQPEREIVTSVENWFDVNQLLGHRQKDRETSASRRAQKKEESQILTTVDDWFDVGKLFGCFAAREGHEALRTAKSG
mmetsp:Transcript_87476/g.209260  ORF Transcript_87476/g.209260 Transcript_87476/m.209260 type:complete len:186 (+) Transcript_87476:64-621(+)|eukprot:CAMPEP_0181438098 /NCGR_PEP_ID=MMETSP1110-20121109/21729_1 /TAXON_ID=174948 /ORGANISM="Symbiodinium sp., Strain CCMP421" /LENGTH=185 /DNA_ID=CAMNT_0023561765 /DNA_START=56 /DNA_END=613 /DNA_ORIENTATION=-